MAEPTQTNTDITFVNGLPIPTRTTRKQLVIGTLIFCASMIAYVVIKGEPTNSLHSSALAWSYTLMGATLFAYVFGAIMDNFNVIKNQSK